MSANVDLTSPVSAGAARSIVVTAAATAVATLATELLPHPARCHRQMVARLTGRPAAVNLAATLPALGFSTLCHIAFASAGVTSLTLMPAPSAPPPVLRSPLQRARATVGIEPQRGLHVGGRVVDVADDAFGAVEHGVEIVDRAVGAQADLVGALGHFGQAAAQRLRQP